MRRNARRGVRVLTAGAPPAPATIQIIEGELGWEITHIYGMTETSPFISICEPRPQHNMLPPQQRAAIKARQGVELITSGELRVVDTNGCEVPHDGETMGEIVARRNVVMSGYFRDPEATAHALRGGWMHTVPAYTRFPEKCGYRARRPDVLGRASLCLSVLARSVPEHTLRDQSHNRRQKLTGRDQWTLAVPG